MPTLGFTPSAQRVLIYLLKERYVSYGTQRIMESNRFYKVMGFLLKKGLVKKKCVVCRKNADKKNSVTCGRNDFPHRHNKNRYSLFCITVKGEILAYILSDMQ